MGEIEAAASRAFLQALTAQLKSGTDEDGKDIEYVIEHLIPVLVPAIVHLLKTMTENDRREHDGEQHVLPVKPLDHLAKYLFRHNPRHSEPTEHLVNTFPFASVCSGQSNTGDARHGAQALA